MTYQFAQVNGIAMHYDLQGQGPALVLLHAGIANLDMWDAQMQAFSEHFTVLRYDIRGWGQTPDPAGDYAEHGDLEALMNELGLEHAHILGISNGGRIAIDFAIAYPSRVDQLIVVAPSLGGFVYPDDKFLIEIRAKREEALEAGDIELAAEFEARALVDGPNRNPDEVDSDFREKALSLIKHSLELPEGLGKGIPLMPYAVDRLAEIKAKTLAIIGDMDIQMIAPVIDSLAKEIPNCRKLLMPGTAHLPNMEKAASFNKIVLDFLLE